jgi:glutamate dehydrogenase
MTEEVGQLVLRDNYQQTQAISVAQAQGVALLDAQARLMRRLAPSEIDDQGRFTRFLEKQGRLHRGIEFLPTDEELAERKAKSLGLTTPEQAVLLAYCKMWLSDELVASDLPEDPWVGTALERYFPTMLKQKFGDVIPRHPLRREIIATHVLNSMVNRVGPTFAHQLSELTGQPAPQVVRAYLLAREVFGSVQLWQRIEALDNKVPDSVQSELIIEWRRLITRATTWFLRSRRLEEPMERGAQRLQPAVASLRERLAPEAAGTPRVEAWVAAGVPQELAQQVGCADRLFNALDIAEVVESAHSELAVTADVHFGIGERLGLEKLRQQIDLLDSGNHWQALAKIALADDLADLQRSIALDAVSREGGAAAQRLSAWEARNPMAFARARRLVAELADAAAPDLAMLSVALRELRNLV